MNSFGLPFPPGFDPSRIFRPKASEGPVNWEMARFLGTSIARDADTSSHWEHVQEEYDNLVRAAEMLVSQYTGLTSPTLLTPVKVVSRAGWVEENIEMFSSLIEPLGKKIAEAQAPSRAGASFHKLMDALIPFMLGAQAGMLAGMASHHVLGRHDLQLPPPKSAKLVFVAPNLEEAERNLNVVPRDFKFWVVMHEVIHAIVFSQQGVRETYESLIIGVTETLEVNTGQMNNMQGIDFNDQEAMRRLMNDPSAILDYFSSPAQEAALEEMKSFVSFVEGYCAHVIGKISQGNIQNLAHIEMAIDNYNVDQEQQTSNVFKHLLGFDMHRNQFDVPKEFCDDIVEKAGIDALNRVWHDPLARPSLREFGSPQEWLDRQF